MSPNSAQDTSDTTRKRLPPNVRKHMIITSAREIIAAQGLQATTLRDIARASDVAVGTVTYHFSGIAEVLAGVLEAEMTEFSAPVMVAAEQAATGREGLDIITGGLLASGERAIQHWRLWLDFWTLAARQSPYAQWQQAVVYHNLHGLVEHLLRRGSADGTLNVSDPVTASVEYIALMDGLVVHGYLPGSRLNPDAARDMLQGYVIRSFAVADE